MLIMKVLVCGGRKFGEHDSINEKPEWLVKEERRLFDYVMSKIKPIDFIVHGNAKGADRLAKYWARKHSIEETNEKYSAEWDKFGKAAGMIRNRDMLESEDPDLIVAFCGNVGTNGMVSISEKANKKIIRITKHQ
jgi:hypothetical protein